MSPPSALAPRRRVGVGVLGCAGIALRRFLPALAASNLARLVAIASRDPARAAATAGRFGGCALGYADLLDRDEVELVYVPLPNHLHEPWVLAALERGKHVLCEKPLGLTPESVDRMISAAERRGRLLFENLMFLEHPQHRTVLEVARSGRIGEVLGLDCRFHIPGLPPDDFRLDPERGGGAFHDLNRYPLAAAGRLLEGRLERIERCDVAWRGRLDLSVDAEALTTVGERLSFSVSFERPYRCDYAVIGTDGVLRLERAFTPPPDHACRLQIEDASGVEVLRLPAADQFLATIDHVAALIATAGPYTAEHARSRTLADAASRFHARARPGGANP